MSDTREFPAQFSTPLQKVLKAISIGTPNVVGSGADHRLLYVADYDLIEQVVVSAGHIRAFKKTIQSCQKIGKVVDIKCGELKEWNLMEGVTIKVRKVVGYDQKKELAHLRELWQKEIVTHDEFMTLEKMLKPSLTVPEAFEIRQISRFGVLRWTPAEVLAGHKTLRDDKTIYLEDAVKTKGITKIDVVAWVKDRYAEVSNIIIWTNRSGKPFVKLLNFNTSVAENISSFESEGNYMKVAKRMLSLAKVKKDTAIMEKLFEILNSPLGALYLVTVDLEVLEDFPQAISQSRKREELDLMRDRFAKLYFPQFNKATPSLKLLPELEETLQNEVEKVMKEARLLPVPRDYLP